MNQIQLMENTDAAAHQCQDSIENIYLHMLKFKYQKNGQSASWCGSIASCYSNLKKYASKKAVKDKLKNDQEKLNNLYSEALDKAAKETGLNKNTFPQEIPKEWNIDNITDKNYLIKFLTDNACTDSAVKWLENPKETSKFIYSGSNNKRR